MSYVYLMKSGGFYKIGHSANPAKRLESIQTGNPVRVVLLHAVRTSFAKPVEQALHNAFRNSRVQGEWFTLTPYIEKDFPYIVERCEQVLLETIKREVCDIYADDPNNFLKRIGHVADGTDVVYRKIYAFLDQGLYADNTFRRHEGKLYLQPKRLREALGNKLEASVFDRALRYVCIAQKEKDSRRKFAGERFRRVHTSRLLAWIMAQEDLDIYVCSWFRD